jgi:transposase
MGERFLRRLLIIGANSVIIKRHVHAAARPGTWLGGMPMRKPAMLVRAALANRMARIVRAFAIGLEPMAPDGSLARGGVSQSPVAAA